MSSRSTWYRRLTVEHLNMMYERHTKLAKEIKEELQFRSKKIK